MYVTQISGSQIRDGRLLAGISPQQLATRARVSRLTIRSYELCGDTVPPARVDKLGRVVTALEDAGIRFAANAAGRSTSGSGTDASQAMRASVSIGFTCNGATPIAI